MQTWVFCLCIESFVMPKINPFNLYINCTIANSHLHEAVVFLTAETKVMGDHFSQLNRKCQQMNSVIFKQSGASSLQVNKEEV